MKKEDKKLCMAKKDAASASGCVKQEAVCIIRRKSDSGSRIYGPYPFRINMNGMEEYRKQYTKWENHDIALMAATAVGAIIAVLMLIISTSAFLFFVNSSTKAGGICLTLMVLSVVILEAANCCCLRLKTDARKSSLHDGMEDFLSFLDETDSGYVVSVDKKHTVCIASGYKSVTIHKVNIVYAGNNDAGIWFCYAPGQRRPDGFLLCLPRGLRTADVS